MSGNNNELSKQIEQLQTKINLTRLEFSSRIDTLQQNLDDLKQPLLNDLKQPILNDLKKQIIVDVFNQADVSKKVEQSSAPTNSITISPKPPEQDIKIEKKEQWVQPQSVIQDSIQDTKKANIKVQDTKVEDNSHNIIIKPNKPVEEIEKNETILDKLGRSLIMQLIGILNLIAAPLIEVFNKVISLYEFYHKQGKAPVFLMTVAGIITLTFGFGYLLQYAFYSLFNDTLKAITGFVIGGGISVLGIYLSVKKSEFSEYAASIIALGVIFNYLTAYFIGPYYQIVSPFVSFILLISITCYSTLLAKIFETKVVAAITLIAGLLIPVISGQINESYWVYFVYLFVLMFVNLYLSITIKWSALGKLTFVMGLSMLHYLQLSTQVHPYLAVFCLSITFIVFVYYFSFNGLQLKEKLDRKTLTLLVANLFYFIYAMFSIQEQSWLVALCFALSLAVLIATVRLFNILKSNIAPMYILFIALLSACIIFVLAPAEFNNVLWLLEALILLFIGFKYQFTLIRIEGYLLFIYAMFNLAWMTVMQLDKNNDLSFLIGLTIFTLFSYALYKIVAHYYITSTSFENKIKQFFIELYSFSSVSLVCSVLLMYTDSFVLWLFLPIILCWFNIKLFSVKTGPVVLFAILTTLLLSIISSVTSPIYVEQNLQTWIMSIELLVALWLGHVFFLKFKLKSWSNDLMRILQYVVYGVPIVLTIFSTINIINHLSNPLNQSTFDALWFDLLVISTSFAVLYGSLFIKANWINNETLKKQKYILNESISFFAVLFFLYTSYILIDTWTFILMPVVICATLYRSLKFNLMFSEKLAWSCFIFYAIMVFYGYSQVNTFHFSDQPYLVMIGYFELMFNAWLMLTIYQRLNFKTSLYQFSKWVRLFIYVILPLFFLGKVARLYVEFLPVAIFASFFISWFLHRILKYKVLLIESKILFYCAVLSTVYVAVLAVTGTAELPGLIAIIVGLVTITVISKFENILSITKHVVADYKIQLQQSPYFYIFAVFALSFAVLGHLLVSLALTSIALYYLLMNTQLKHIIRPSLTFAYVSMVLCLSIAIIDCVLQIRGELELTQSIYMALALSVVLRVCYLVCFTTNSTLLFLNEKVATQVIFYWIFHTMLALSYIGFINYALADWSILISILLLLQALFVLFLTLKERYKSLIKLSLVLYVLTAIKVLIYDLAGSSNIEKVIALMVMGSILMIGAYVFQKYRLKSTQESTQVID
ncbi:MAG: DUF2339 domain-containing protein [Saccharospirillaceae bacterium]|nr:DUF2339 domain-containing protein [Pseudomonadales bacterium]NRB79931.1 DUF2339 domain-containing protein [Saccharospirillaceae bacterium]